MSAFTQPYHDAAAQLTGAGAPFEVVSRDLDGVPVRAFRNAASRLDQYLDGGRRHGAAPLLHYQGANWSFDDFFRAVDRLSNWLRSEAGTASGTRVAIAMRNRPEWLVAFVAVVNAGATAVLLNSWGRGRELGQGLADSGAELLICDAPRLAFARESQPDLPALVVDPESSQQVDQDFADIIGRDWNGELPAVVIDPDDPAILMFTSGTSGRPKGVLVSHFNCCQSLMNLEFVGAATYMTNQEAMNRQLASGVPAKTLLAVPLFHISGLFSQFIVNMHHGRSLHIMYKWDAAEALRLIREKQITVVMGAPVMMLDLLSNPEFHPEDARHLTNVSSGGAATPEALSNLYRDKAGNAFSGGGWGMTETLGTGAAFTGYYYEQRPAAAGFPSPIMEYSFRGEDGMPVPAGEPGEICVRSGAAIQHYNSADDSGSFPDGWFATGDIGYIDSEGLLYICGRVKDMIIRGGENVYPSEVEACLLTLPGCLEAAVVGTPHDTWGEEVAAVVRVRPDHGLDPEAVINHCRQQLAGFKVPAHLQFTEEALPRNALKKLIKTDILARYFPND